MDEEADSPLGRIKAGDLNDIFTCGPEQFAHADFRAKGAEDTHVVLNVPMRQMLCRRKRGVVNQHSPAAIT